MNSLTQSEKDELKAKAHQLVKGGATLLDVRTPEEYAAGHLEGAINIPVQTLQARLGELKRGPVVVHCQMGGRATTAEQILRASGYPDVLNLLSINNW